MLVLFQKAKLADASTVCPSPLRENFFCLNTIDFLFLLKLNFRSIISPAGCIYLASVATLRSTSSLW